MQDAWRAYLELALGLTEASKKRAQTVARKLVDQSGTTAAQLQGLAEEVMSTSLANRAALTKIVRFEVERALGVVGLATADEVADLTTRVRELEQELRTARRSAADGGAAAPADTGGEPAAPGKALARQAPGKKALAKKATVGGDPAVRAAKAAKAAPAKKAAKVAPAKKAAKVAEAAKAAKAVPAKAAKAGPEPATPGQAAPAKKIAPKKLPPVAKKTAAKKLPPAAGPATA